MMADRTLRAGLIGLGAMGRHHARVLREIDGVDLVAVADPAGDPHGVAGALPVLQDVQALIAAGIDTAVVAVPTVYHEAIALALAEAGVHALIEKPIADTSAAGERIVAAFASQGLVGAVGHIERFNPALQEMRKRLAAGELGEIYQIATRRTAFGVRPARGGSSTTTSGLGMPASSSGRTAFATSPWTNSAFMTPLRSALSTARSTASGTTSIP